MMKKRLFSILGILLAIFAVLGIDKYINLSAYVPASVSTVLAIVLLAAMVAMVWFVAKGKKKSN